MPEGIYGVCRPVVFKGYLNSKGIFSEEITPLRMIPPQAKALAVL